MKELLQYGVLIMKNIEIKGEGIVLRDITEKEAQDVYFWYSDSKDYKHATGINSGLCLQEFYDLWREAVIKKDEFFLSIFIEHSNKCLGFIKGEIVRDGSLSVYISAFAVDKKFRRKKIGTKALSSLLKFIKTELGCSNVFVTVYLENHTGINFWFNNGFNFVKKISKKGLKDNTVILAVFMKREL